MEASSSKSIDITMISAEGLLMSRNRLVRENSTVVVRTDPYNSRSTGVDPERDSCSSWKEKLVMDLPDNSRFITVGAHVGSRIIGSANIPVMDSSGGYLPENYLSFLSYRLWDAGCERNGIVNLSVKVILRNSGNIHNRTPNIMQGLLNLRRVINRLL